MSGLRLVLVLASLTALVGNQVFATTYVLPPQDIDIIGRPQTATIKDGETLLDVARRFDVGQQEIVLANPGVPRWIPSPGQQVLIPSQVILPDVERTDAVLNLAEMRLYHFQQKIPGLKRKLSTYPVSIGQVDWHTPLGDHFIVKKRENPSWTPPESIHREAEALGKSLPRVFPPGPNNPLGEFALNLDRPGYLIHGTNKPYGIGMRVTHGCVRLYPEDIRHFYQRAPVGTRVKIIHQPVKLGWYAGQLYLEVHAPLQEFYQPDSELFELTVQMVLKALRERPVSIHSSLIRRTVYEKSGVPVRLSVGELPR